MRCVQCGLVFAGELPSPAELSEYYARYPASGELTPLTTRRYEELLARLDRFRETNRLLDIGCGDGHFLVAARDAGWTVFGSEYGDGPRERAQACGLDVRPAPFSATSNELGSFDVVVSIEVFEHVTSPRDEAVRIRTMLRPGGCLYLTTPNFNALSRRLAGPRWRIVEYPEHLQLFTPRTLDRMLASVPFKRLSVTTSGISVSDLLSGVRPEHRQADKALGPSADQRLRAGLETSVTLDWAVRAANSGLSRLGAGDTIKAMYVRQ